MHRRVKNKIWRVKAQLTPSDRSVLSISIPIMSPKKVPPVEPEKAFESMAFQWWFEIVQARVWLKGV
jgi:hypothetical protein